MWKAKRRGIEAEKTVPRTLAVPEENIPEIMRLLDEDAREKTRVSHYNLWKKIEEIFPDTISGQWQLRVKATRVDIVEKLEG